MTLYVTKLLIELCPHHNDCKESMSESEFKIEIKDESMEHTYCHHITENINTSFSFDMEKFSKINSILSSTKFNDDRLKVYPSGEFDLQSRFPELSFERIDYLSVTIFWPHRRSFDIRLSIPFKTLKRLGLHGIVIDSDLCRDIMEMKDLNELHFSSVKHLNEFPELFENLENLKNLRILSLIRQTFDMDIMKDIHKCLSLEELHFGFVGLTRPIDKRIHDLVNLDILSLLVVPVSNEVLTYIGKLSKLTFLRLRGNNLSCELPTSLDFLSELEHLEISDNEITGSIPKSLGNMTKLKYFNLHNNLLTGIIPEELKNLVNLKHFEIAKNTFDKQDIPYIFLRMKDLKYVDLMLTNFTGTIGDQFINNTKLKVFYVIENEIQDIPDYIKNIKGIDIKA